MNLVSKDSPLAMQVLLNSAILLQQLHFRSPISTKVRDGHKWVYTIKRAIRRLEDNSSIISTSSHNRMYRINYPKLQCQTVQYATSTTAKSAQEEVQIAPSTEGKMPLAITKKIKSIKKELVENDLDVVSVTDYLNDKAYRRYLCAVHL